MRHQMGRGGRIVLAFVLGGLVCAGRTASAPAESPAAKPSVEALFAPVDNCPERIVKEVGDAKKTIRIRAGSFASETIAKALVEAKKRGVDCEMVIDASDTSNADSRLKSAHDEGIATFVDADHPMPQGSIILIDGGTIITGSFALSDKSAAGDLLIVKGYPAVAAKYATHYGEHRGHATKYDGQATAQDDGPTLVREGGATSKGTAASGAKADAGGSAAGGAEASDGQCTATTKKGTRCTRKAKTNGKCWQHGG